MARVYTPRVETIETRIAKARGFLVNAERVLSESAASLARNETRGAPTAEQIANGIPADLIDQLRGRVARDTADVASARANLAALEG